MDERLRAVEKDDREPSHLSPEMLADLLSGEIEPDDLRNRVVPHLMARCPVCRRRVEGVRRLQERFDHWNESVAVREGQDAPRLLARLMEHPEQRRLQRLMTDEDFHTWGLAQLLLRKSREQALEDAHQALVSAELAVVVSDHLPEQPYHPDWLGDLKARAWAVLGNARRVAGELGTADMAFQRAEALLAGHAATGRPRVRAEVLDLLASLRREQGRFEEAHRTLEEAEALFRQEGDRHRVGRVLINRARNYEEEGRLEAAVGLLSQAPELLDHEKEPHLSAYVQHNLTHALVRLGQFQAARKQFQGLAGLRNWSPLELQHLRALGGRIAAGFEEWEGAERAFWEVRAWFLEHDLIFDAALVTLDLALVLLEQGRDDELQKLAAEVLPLFQERGVTREALAALLLFQQALERKSLTAELLREVREVAERRRGGVTIRESR